MKVKGKNYPKKVVDVAREAIDFFTYEDGVCTNKYEVVEDFGMFLRDDLGVRISLDEFMDVVDAVLAEG